MAFCATGSKPGLDAQELLYSSGHSSMRVTSFSCHASSKSRKCSFTGHPEQIFCLVRAHAIHRVADTSRRPGFKIKCCKGKVIPPSDFNENPRNVKAVHIEDELNHATRFKMSDFELYDRVSVGLAGRGDELIFEAKVNNSQSPLHNTRVVLRKLTTTQAQRRGKRALEVLKKLARRRLMYHSYAMQVHGFVVPCHNGDQSSFTLIHGYHGSYSLRHWLQLSDWIPNLESTLALDEDCVRRVGDNTIGGPATSRQLRIIRILMRDLLIGVNYLHSHGLAHTELRLENVHISPVDRHIKVGILGNASDFYDNSLSNSTCEGSIDRRQHMIAFDMRCVGFMMAKMVMRELMDPSVFVRFKSFLNKGNDPSCLREFLLPILCKNSPSGNAGLQILDRNWGAGWSLLSLLLATKPSDRISCLDALRHPFLCGPRWRVDPSLDIIKWGLGSTAVRITEEYIYVQRQRSRLAYFIELMELLNPHPRAEDWLELLPGKWRLLYSTGRQIGLTLRRASPRVLIGNVNLSFSHCDIESGKKVNIASEISFNVFPGDDWPHNKVGIGGKLSISSAVGVVQGSRVYIINEGQGEDGFGRTITITPQAQEPIARKLSRKWRKLAAASQSMMEEFPSSLPAAEFVAAAGEIDVTMRVDCPSLQEVGVAGEVLREVRTQIPSSIFDVNRIVCGTYVDCRLLVLRGVDGSALLLTRAPTP